MLYSRAVGPAALPLELSCLARGLAATAPDIPVAQLFRLIERAVGPVAAEWTALRGPGRLDPAAIAQAKGRAAGIVASWDLNRIPSANLEVLGGPANANEPRMRRHHMAALLLKVVNNMFNLLGIQVYIQYLVTGVIILTVVGFDSYSRHKQ